MNYYKLMMGETLRLRYLEDTNNIIQMWPIGPYNLYLIFDLDGIMVEFIYEELDKDDDNI